MDSIGLCDGASFCNIVKVEVGCSPAKESTGLSALPSSLMLVVEKGNLMTTADSKPYEQSLICLLLVLLYDTVSKCFCDGPLRTLKMTQRRSLPLSRGVAHPASPSSFHLLLFVSRELGMYHIVTPAFLLPVLLTTWEGPLSLTPRFQPRHFVTREGP